MGERIFPDREREDIVGRKTIHELHRCLLGFFQLRAGHGTGAVEHHGEVERRAPGFFPCGDGREVNLHDDLRRRTFQHDFAVGDEFEVEGFAGEQVRGDDCGQTEEEQCFLHALTLPAGANELSGGCERFVKKL